MKEKQTYHLKLSPSALIFITFAATILIGTVLLLLPFSTPHGHNNFLNALFIATSATCVTGLSVVNIAQEYTLFGQIVILLMIQVGGLGIMTFSTFFFHALTGEISLSDRDVLTATVLMTPEKNTGTLLGKILIAVFTIETAGAFLLCIRFSESHPLGQALYLSIFHSISGFCNAGFSLFPDSFMAYKSDPFLNLVLISLILSGGIGFHVLLDLKRLFIHKKGIRHLLSFQTRIVLTMSALLILFGTLAYFLIEHNHSLAGFNFENRLLISLFQSVTSRTCGYNTVDMATLSNAGVFLVIVLMFIGAAPGSAAGGVKVTALGVLIAMALSRLRGEKETSIFNRSIPSETVTKTFFIFFTAISVISVAFILLLASEAPPLPNAAEGNLFRTILFETVSAFGTVGLSMGLTPGLSDFGKTVIIIIMFIGRIGPLTLFMTMTSMIRRKSTFKFARGDLMIG